MFHDSSYTILLPGHPNGTTRDHEGTSQTHPRGYSTAIKLHEKLSSEDYIYIRINKEMYDLKQAAILVYKNLKQSLAPYGYSPIIGTVGIWGHKTRLTKFCLCVDDFGIKYFSKLDAQHL